MSKTTALTVYTQKDMFEAALNVIGTEPDVEFVDLHVDGRYEGHGRRAVPVPGFAPNEATLRVVDSFVAKEPLTHVVASSESNIAFAAFLRSRYGLPGMQYDQALLVTNKYRMKQAVAGRLPAAASWLAGDFLELARRHAVPPLVVVKPLSGSSTKGVELLSTGDALTRLARSDELMVVEEALDVSHEMHCDGIMRSGQLRFTVASIYNRPVLARSAANLASIHLPHTDPRAQVAVEYARHAVGAFPLDDFVFHLELLLVDTEVFFGEIGLRPPGGRRSQSVKRFFGLDLWEEFVRVELGRAPGFHLPMYRPTGYCGVIGMAASPQYDGRPQLNGEELRALPGVVEVHGGTRRAMEEAKLGSSVAYTHTILFDCAGEEKALELILAIEKLGQA